jgi:ribosome-binding protein aMBF1 (putative translation factor)
MPKPNPLGSASDATLWLRRGRPLSVLGRDAAARVYLQGLLDARLRAGMSRARLAALLFERGMCVSISTLRDWEYQRSSAPKAAARYLAAALNTSQRSLYAAGTN